MVPSLIVIICILDIIFYVTFFFSIKNKCKQNTNGPLAGVLLLIILYFCLCITFLQNKRPYAV